MAIAHNKPKTPAEREAAIVAFGRQADSLDEPAPEKPTDPTPAKQESAPSAARAGVKSAGEWPVGMAKNLLIRYPDPQIPTMLAELARLEERSQHAAAVRALRRGLEVLLAESGE